MGRDCTLFIFRDGVPVREFSLDRAWKMGNACDTGLIPISGEKMANRLSTADCPYWRDVALSVVKKWTTRRGNIGFLIAGDEVVFDDFGVPTSAMCRLSRREIKKYRQREQMQRDADEAIYNRVKAELAEKFASQYA